MVHTYNHHRYCTPPSSSNMESDSLLSSSASSMLAALPGKHRRFSHGKPYEKGPTVAEWVNLIQEYNQVMFKSKQQFLREKGLTSSAHRVTFHRKLKQYEAGELQKSSNRQRVRQGKYHNVESKLVEYINLRNRMMQRDKCGLSFSLLQTKARQFATELGVDAAFEASPDTSTSSRRVIFFFNFKRSFA